MSDGQPIIGCGDDLILIVAGTAIAVVAWIGRRIGRRLLRRGRDDN